MAAAIEIHGVSKRFRLASEKYQSAKERLLHFRRVEHSDFWALRDIDLHVEPGTTVGLLGHNGSGKSTLLKCIAGILQPTEGEIHTTGRLAALLELGAGFHPELTGRENVYLNASILGLSRREITRRFDEIVDFSELDQFIDQQVRHYSSGMYARLGFAVAVNVEPDILLVDEVLAVGDEAFQRKCLDRVRQFQRDGRTIIVVTHTPDLVRQVCDQAAVLDHGVLVHDGDPGKAVRVFRETLLADDDEQATDTAPGAGPRISHALRVGAVRLYHPGGDDRAYAIVGEPLVLEIAYETTEPIVDPVLILAIYDLEGRMLFATNTRLLETPLGTLDGEGTLSFTIERVPFLDGTYPISFGVTSADGGVVFEWQEQEHRFEVMNPGRSEGWVDVPVHVEVHAARSAERSVS